MPELSIELYGPIGAALLTVIGVLWRRLDAKEAQIEAERAENKSLYRELVQDTEALEAIHTRLESSANEGRQNNDLLRMVVERLDALSSHLSRSSGPQPPSQNAA